MTERKLWVALRPVFQGLELDAHRVENGLGRGMPDVNYTHGWVELKQVAGWPKDEARPLKIPALESEPQQVAWLMRRWAAGGLCWIMLRVGKGPTQELLLFSGWDARLVRQGSSREALYQLAVWSSRFGHSEEPTLKRVLSGDWESLPAPTRAKLLRLRCLSSVETTALKLGWSPDEVRDGERYQTWRTNDLLDHWLA